MADPKQIEQELREYLEKEPNIRRDDRMAYLMTIINKHFEIDKLDHVVTHYDFDQLISYAKTSFINTKLPMYVSRKEIHSTELAHILLLEAFVGYLNKNKILKRLVKFDYGDKMAKEKRPKGPKTLLEKVDSKFPQYSAEVLGLSVEQLDKRIAGLQKGLEDAANFREEKNGEAIRGLKAELKDLNEDYTEVRKEVTLKTKFLISLVREKVEHKMDDAALMLLRKITNLAVTRQQPLIILENPRFAAYKAGMLEDKNEWPNEFIATIGSAACTFQFFSVSDLTEIYASLRSQLERNEAMAQNESVQQNQSGAV